MLDEHIAYVKSQVEICEDRVKRYAPGGGMESVVGHEKSKAALYKSRSLLSYLLEQKRLSQPIPKALGDISDLPEELLKELAVTQTDELEDQILTVVRACNGEANLDQVLVGLFRKFKVVQTRRYLQNKMYRMGKKELLHAIEGQRASYTLHPQPPKQNTVQTATSRAPAGDLDEDIPF